MDYIETARRARRLAGRPRRRWPWVIVVNLVLFMAIVLMAEGRFTKMEHRIETMRDRDEWRGELATARSELGEAAAGLRSEVTKLRSEIATLRREAGTDEAALRDGLDSLGDRVDRIEVMVVALWRAPANGARLGATS